MLKIASTVMFLLLLALSPVCAGQSRDASSELLLNNIQEAIGTIRTLEADFVQTRHLAVFEDELKSEGKIYFIAPDHLRWQIKRPYQSALIFNQGKVAKFEIKKGQLRKMKLAGSLLFAEIMGQMINILRGDFAAIEKEYKIETKRKKSIEVTLKPRSKKLAKMLKSITLFMHPEKFRVKKLIIQEEGEDKLEIAFEREKENKELAPSLFSLKSPSGFELETSQ